jgi:hypothetical protein
MANYLFIYFSNSTTNNMFQGIARVGSKPTWAVLPPEEHSPKQNKNSGKLRLQTKEQGSKS